MKRSTRVCLLTLCTVTALVSAQSTSLEITVREGTSMAAALSPDGRTLVIDLQGGLWTLPVSGGAAQRIVDEYYDARQPAWSPDGKTIAFQSFRDGMWRIWTVSPDGSNPVAITTGPFDDREPHWSPDGSRLAFSSDRSGNYDIWSIDLRTREVRQVTRHPDNDFFPTWSPNGQEIAFVSTRRPAPGVYTVTLDGAERLIVETQGNVGAPAWTADGRDVLYSVVNGGIARLMLGRTELSASEDVFPFRAQWLSATEFLYTADGKIKRRTTSDAQRREIPFAATLAVRPAAYTPRARDFNATTSRPVRGLVHPRASRDGSRIAFVALGDLWVMRVGGPPERVTNDSFVESDPAWSPDGTELAFSADRAGSMDVYVRNLRTGQDRRLTTAPDAEMGAAWSPDGKRIAFTSNIAFKQGETYVVDAEGGEPRKLADRSFGPGYPMWSPDGRFVVISTLRPYSSRFREGMNYLIALPIDGGAPREIVPVEHKPVGKRSGDGPVWSPDGRHMAYVSDGYLHVMPVTPAGAPSGAPRRVTRELADSPSWAGNDEILYIAADRLKLASISSARTRDVAVDLQWSRRVPSTRLIVHAGSLVDGVQRSARADVDIVIQGHRIAAIEPHRAELHSSGTVVDASGQTVMPGLIEAHGHPHREHGEAFGRIHLAYGITAVRSPGGHPYESIEEREAVESGRRLGPRLFLTGYLLDGSRPYYPMATTAADETIVDLELERARRLEYDLLKTYVRLPDLLQKRAIDAAHKIGIPVSSHEIYPAALSGVDSVEHTGATSRRGYSPKQSATGRAYDDVIQIIATSKMTITPTAALGGFNRLVAREPAVLDDARMRLFPAWVRESARASGAKPQPVTAQGLNPALVTIKRLHDAGARIIAGTDSPLVPYGISLHGELEDYVAAGLTPFEALQTATLNTARLLNAADDLGSIQVGKLADLVVVDGNPLTDIKAARNVRIVIKNGEAYAVTRLLSHTNPPR